MNFKYCIILFFGLLQTVISADNIYDIRSCEEPVRISNKFEFYFDHTNSLTINNVWNQKFIPADKDVPNFNITTATVWGKIKFTTRDTGNWYLSLDPGTYLKILIYQKKKNGEWEEQALGNASDIKYDRAIKISKLLFKLNLRANDTIQFAFKINEYYPVTIDVKVGPLESFIKSIHYMDIYHGVCYGIMIMMLIYNLYLFITNKGIVYIHYVLYVFFSILFTAILSGYAYHIPEWLMAVINFAPIIPPAGFGIFGMFFAIDLFRKSLSKKFINFIYVFMSMAFLDIILSATRYVHLSEDLIQILGLLLGIISMTAGIIALRKKENSARYYLLGFGAYMASLFYLIFSAQGVFPITSFTWCVLVSGSAIESIMLSFALGDKFKLFQKEKEKAQEESLKQSLENERLVREQNSILEQKVKERTLELSAQKEIVEEKNKEIVDSINYAKKIQYTLLAHESVLSKNLNEHFVLFKPKDIVSGDFYWATEYHNDFYLAVCDSTGHGVPGAFMSLLNISFLNEAINEQSLKKPNEVFNHVRKRLIDNISQEDQKDGMDGILVAFNKKNKTICYSAANNRPLLIRNNSIIDLGYDKMPIGKGEKMDSFNSFEFQYEKGDTLYLFTDGFSDQFGGLKGKKFKYKNLVEQLLEINNNPLNSQKQRLETIFNNWKGTLEQVDDVLLVGIKL